MNSELTTALLYTLPSLVSGFVAYFFLKEYTKSDVGLQKFNLLKEKKKLGITLRLQAYERMTIFLERISPANLVFRIKAKNDDKQAYELSLLHTIETEFEHNLSQQIYITDECWKIITAAKNATIQHIRTVANKSSTTNSHELREAIIKEITNKQTPSDTALLFIKNEVNDLF